MADKQEFTSCFLHGAYTGLSCPKCSQAYGTGLPIQGTITSSPAPAADTTAREWLDQKMGESGLDIGRAVQDLVCSNAYEAFDKLELVLKAYASSHLSKVAEKAAPAITTRYLCVEGHSEYDAIVEAIAAIIKQVGVKA